MGQECLECPCCGGAVLMPPRRGETVGCPHCQREFARSAARRWSGPLVATPRGEEPWWAAAEAEWSSPEPSESLPAAAGLPMSVVIGLALLPFGVPICWLIGPPLLGQMPAVSLAVPLALAAGMSVLCLSVIYTVDWSAGTRLKGVGILVALAYFIGLTLYFTKKETLERLYRLGREAEWEEFRAPQGPAYSVRVPFKPQPLGPRRLALADLVLYESRDPLDVWIGRGIHYQMGAGDPLPRRAAQDPDPGSDAWFDQARQTVLRDSSGDLVLEFRGIRYGPFPGRQWEIQLPDPQQRQVVRLFVIRGKVYYLSVQGQQIAPEHQEVHRFFQSFFVPQQD